MTIYKGGCLCGAVRFSARGPAARPHTCSCRMCQRHSGAPTLAWVEFPAAAVTWDGAPSLWRSSPGSSRAFCPACGSTLGAVDDDPVVALALGVFDAPDAPELRPAAQSYPENHPDWLRISP